MIHCIREVNQLFTVRVYVAEVHALSNSSSKGEGCSHEHRSTSRELCLDVDSLRQLDLHFNKMRTPKLACGGSIDG